MIIEEQIRIRLIGCLLDEELRLKMCFWKMTLGCELKQ